jgi:dUTP pyrophosphatase
MPGELEFELKVLDPRLYEWGLPAYASEMAAGLDLRACIDAPVEIEPQAPAAMIPAGIAVLINRPDIAAFILPRSGLGARLGLIIAQSVGTIDADYAGPWLIPLINRNAADTPPVIINPGHRSLKRFSSPSCGRASVWWRSSRHRPAGAAVASGRPDKLQLRSAKLSLERRPVLT